jgi:hypothetical protein
MLLAGNISGTITRELYPIAMALEWKIATLLLFVAIFTPVISTPMAFCASATLHPATCHGHMHHLPWPAPANHSCCSVSHSLRFLPSPPWTSPAALVPATISTADFLFSEPHRVSIIRPIFLADTSPLINLRI